MGKIDDGEFLVLVFFLVLGVGSFGVMGWLMYCGVTTPRPRFICPPPPPKKKEAEKPGAYSFLQLCSYKQLKVLEELFPPQKPIPFKNVGDLYVFKDALNRQIQMVQQHIKDFKNETGTDADG